MIFADCFRQLVTPKSDEGGIFAGVGIQTFPRVEGLKPGYFSAFKNFNSAAALEYSWNVFFSVARHFSK